MSIKINCDHKARNYCFRIYYNKQEQSQNRKQRCCEVLPQFDANFAGIRTEELSLVKIDSMLLQEPQMWCFLPFRVRLKLRTDNCREKSYSASSKCIMKNTDLFDAITEKEIAINRTFNCHSYSEVVKCVKLKVSSSVASFSASTLKIYNHNTFSPKSENSVEKVSTKTTFLLRTIELVSIVKNETKSVTAAASRPEQRADNFLNINSRFESRRQIYSDHSKETIICNKECALMDNRRQYIKRKIIRNTFNRHRTYENKNNLPLQNIWQTARILLQHQQHHLINLFLIMLLFMTRAANCHGLLEVDPKFVSLPAVGLLNGNSDSSNILNSNYNNNTRIGIKSGLSSTSTGGGSIVGLSSSSSALVNNGGGHYLDKLDNLERSVAAVLIKVAYGTTSTTKRSIPDNSYVPSLTTIATPPLTTLRYLEKSPHQQQINVHHRNYELDLERDHALPTSAPNADILKSNSNPTYPNPNRHHNHERDRHRHGLVNSTPSPSMPNTIKKSNGQLPTVPLYPGDMPSYSPPARSFFTPPLPPEYQNPFADKPTLRGTNNEGVIANTGSYINRRPIPPPSLMPGHERIPFRPPDLAGSSVVTLASGVAGTYSPSTGVNPFGPSHPVGIDADRKKALNTPSRGIAGGQPISHSNGVFNNGTNNQFSQETTTQVGNYGGGGSGFSSENQPTISTQHNTRKEVLPSIRRILSGSNGNKGEIPEVILKQVTSRPVVNYHQPPSSPVVLIDSISQDNKSEDIAGGLVSSSNINKSKNNRDGGNGSEEEERESSVSGNGNEKKLHSKTKMSTKSAEYPNEGFHQISSVNSSTPSSATALREVATSTYSTTIVVTPLPTSSSSSSSSSIAAAAAAHATWAVAWNIHVYLSVILFTILGVYSFYKMLTYNKLTHLFAQSYFVCIHLILILICTARIFYLCYDAYNYHSTFHIFVSEILLNLPATFLTISFSVLMLFLFLKSLNHKNNRYSALIRPLTVIVGCGVHVVLCITLHYVESYTMQNHQQHLYYQQTFYRQRQQAQQYAAAAAASSPTTSNVQTPLNAPPATPYNNHHTYTATVPPPRVLSLICQIIYIFICLSLGLLYLYIYRILKRILRSKSQNYIHGYQNLSYAIHITIATALLFVLLAALQIFGAISISITRPLIMQVTSEMDWLDWGYQFSLRLIEIAIITLMSWVTGLKTSGGSLDAAVGGDPRGIGGGAGSGGSSGVFGSTSGAGGGSREKHTSHHHHHHHHSNVAGFFLPCTSGSSQEQFETDYPAVCNANTNLHTYTMRTGKLIYDDSFALNSLGGSGGGGQVLSGGGRNSEFQLQQPTYQRPYDAGSLHCSVTNHNNVEFPAQGAQSNNHYHHHGHQYIDYLTDATTDHYENPNFELRSNGSTAANAMQKLTAQTSTTSTSASCSGGSGTSAASQQQMLLLQSDSCYSEPMPQNSYNTSSNYEFNNFERPNFGGGGEVGVDIGSHHPLRDNWSDHQTQTSSSSSRIRDKKSSTHLERVAYENPERRSSNSTHSCTSGGARYASYNCYELGNTNNVRKSGTLNNIASGGGIPNGRNVSLSSGVLIAASQRASGVHTLEIADRYHYQQQTQLPHKNHKGGRNVLLGMGVGSSRESQRELEHDLDSERDEFNIERSSLERASNHSILQQQQNALHNSDDDMMLPSSNAECTNLISNGDDSCMPNKDSNLLADGNTTDQNISSSNSTNSAIGVINGNEQRLLSKTPHYLPTTHSHTHAHSNNTFSNPIVSHHLHHGASSTANTVISPFNHNSFHSSGGLDSVASASSSTNSAESSTTSAAESATSGSMLVAEHGFVRFRALEDINNAQGVGIHNASIRNQNSRNVAVAEQSQPIVAQTS